MSLSNIMTQIAVVEATITGVKRAYDKAPASINEFPCFINWPESGDIDRRPSSRWPTHHIVMELRVLKGGALPMAEAEIRPFLEATMNAFDSNLSLNGACGNSRIIHYDYGVLPYNGTQFLGISFKIDVTEITPYTFSA